MNKVIFLDRDGTINVDHGYVCSMDQWEFCDNAKQALTLLHQLGFKLAVVTNQGGIGKGLYTQQQMQDLHDQVRQLLDIPLVFAHCPHDPQENCKCRKPNVGMKKIIEDQLGEIDYKSSWMIGDKISDVQFGINIRCRPILLKSNYWDYALTGIQIADSLYHGYKIIKKYEDDRS